MRRKKKMKKKDVKVAQDKMLQHNEKCKIRMQRVMMTEMLKHKRKLHPIDQM